MSNLFIGFHGKRGVGKDTCADYLVNKHGFRKLSFATHLKQECAKVWGVPVENFTIPEVKDTPDIKYALSASGNTGFLYYLVGERGFAGWQVHGACSPRRVMQLWSDYQKHLHGGDIYIKRLAEQIKALGDVPIVISDVRYEEEAKFILSKNDNTSKYRATIFQINRIQHNHVDEHQSDEPLAMDYIAGTIFNDFSIQRLELQLNCIVASLEEEFARFESNQPV